MYCSEKRRNGFFALGSAFTSLLRGDLLVKQ
jgi:hypothetical protein